MRPPLAALALVLAGALVAPAVRAQTCEQFRDTLASRVDPGIRGFAMEIVPGSAPIPPGAKVFGTCEGGARKILFFRNGRPAPAGESAAASAPVAAAAPAPASAPAVKAKAAALPVAAAPSAAAAPPRPVAPKLPERPAELPGPARVEGARVAEPDTAVASEAASWPALRSATEPAASATAAAASSGLGESSEPGVLRRLWPWFAGAAGLLLLLRLWVWIAHRRAYDASGLPRGPRLRP